MKNIAFILLLSVTCYAQKNNVYLELTTQYILTTSGTINYERQLFSNTPIMVRVGFGFYASSGFGNTETYYTIPLTINYLIRLSDMNYIDFGIGPNLIGNVFNSSDAPKNILYLFTNIGFRRNFGDSFFWRVHLTPYAINLTKNTYTSGNENIYVVEKFDFPKTWFGFSFGKRF